VPMQTMVCDTPPEPSACLANPGTCDEDDGTCIYPPLRAGAPCEDDDPCTLDDTCNAAGVCEAGPMCESDNPCEVGTCMPGVGCTFTPVADGMSCGMIAADRCCAGACTNISTDESNCGGCGLACDSAETCESVGATTGCDMGMDFSPDDTTGRCTCPGANDACPAGQICRTLAPVANRCAPDAASDCPGTFTDLTDCPNYCGY